MTSKITGHEEALPMPSEITGHEEAPPMQVGSIDRWLSRIEASLGLLSVLFVLALMLMGVAQVAVRVIWKLPIPGYIDYVELMMVVIAFASIGYAERLRAHIRMDFVPSHVSGSRRVFLELVLVSIALITVGILVYATWFSFLRAWQIGDSTMDMHLPIWPSKLVLCVALGLLWLRLALSTIGYGWSLVARDGHRG